MEVSNIGSTLKNLDDLDSQLYSGKKDDLKFKDKEDVNNSVLSDLPSMNFDDFDDESDDLADLLYDDADDIPTKKKSQSKTVPPISPKRIANDFEETESPAKKRSENFKKDTSLDFLNDISLEKSHKEEGDVQNLLTKTLPYKEVESHDSSVENLDGSKLQEEKSYNFLEELHISSPDKEGQKGQHTFASDKTDFLNKLGVDHLESIAPPKLSGEETKNQFAQRRKTISKMEVDFEDDNEIVDTLDFDDNGKDKIKGKTVQRTFMDDLLGNIKESPVSKSTLTLDENFKKVEKQDDDDDAELVFGSYVPTATRSANPVAGQRRSVKFEDDVRIPKPSNSSRQQDKSLKDQTAVLDERSSASRVRTQPPKPALANEDLLQKLILSKPSNESKKEKEQSFSQPQQKNKDFDWLDVSKDDSSTHPSILPTAKDATTAKVVFSDKSLGNATLSSSRRKSSGADWLGMGGTSFLNEKLAETEPKLMKSRSSGQAVGTLVDHKTQDQSLSTDKHFDEVPPWLRDSTKVPESKNAEVNSLPSFEEKATSVPYSEVLVPFVATQHQTLPNEKMAQDTARKVLADRKQTYSAESALAATPSVGHLRGVQSYPTQEQPSSAGENNVLLIHNMLNSLQLERDHLLKSAEVAKLKNEEEMQLREAKFKNQQIKDEEEFQQKLNRMNEEHKADIQNLKAQLTAIESDNRKLVTNQEVKMKDVETDHKREVERLKDLHNQSISAMKQDHEAALTRLKQLKDQEVEAISSTQVYARSLHTLTEQLEARAAELSQLQLRVDDRHQMSLQEKQVQLASKEKELKALEVRLHRQLEEGDEERSRLQQLVLRLENRLQQQTKEGEEDHWDVQQIKAKLEVQKRILDEEQKIHLQQIEREREKLRLAQDSLLNEQKVVLLQLAQERQQLSAEKRDLESLSKRVKEEEYRLNTKKFQSESSAESQRQLLQQEEDKVRVERDIARHESQQLQRGREALEREKRQLKEEREKFDDLRLELRRRAEEVEEMAMRASSDREEGRAALSAARKIESEHHARMNQLMQQIQRLVEKERHLLMERENLGEERMHLEKRKDSMLCSSCKLAVSLPLMALPPGLSQLRQTSSLVNASLPPHSNSDPNLMVWYVTAEKDREFLQDELSFLHSLKDFRKTSTK